MAGFVFFFVVSFIFPIFFSVVQLALFLVLILVGIDLYSLCINKNGIAAKRVMADRLSNGDENKVEIYLESRYAFKVFVRVIDEMPFQFQKRDFKLDLELQPSITKIVEYYVRPVKRGEYEFGSIRCFVSTFLKLASRRFSFDEQRIVPVYPSYIQLRKYELYRISNQLTLAGIKKIRRVGHNMEFEHIKEYAIGDDYRTVNWKATARRDKLMVNQYQDEKSQQVYSLIDMGRVMKSPFEEMTLLDYAINASLVISNIAIRKDDRAGIITFSDKVKKTLPAEKRNSQMKKIMEMLYSHTTGYKETSFEWLYLKVRQSITQRSLLLLYTNFESLSALRRQLPYLISIAKSHLLVVIFFENTELRKIIDQEAENVEDIYIQTIARKFSYEKRLIAKELEHYGISSILTAPQNLTVNTINKYLELKARGMI